MTNDPIPTIFEINSENLTPTSRILFIEPNSTSEDLNSFVNISQFYAQQEYIFDQFYIRAIFIALYTVVFALCFFGEYVLFNCRINWIYVFNAEYSKCFESVYFFPQGKIFGILRKVETWWLFQIFRTYCLQTSNINRLFF